MGGWKGNEGFSEEEERRGSYLHFFPPSLQTSFPSSKKPCGLETKLVGKQPVLTVPKTSAHIKAFTLLLLPINITTG